MTTYDTIVVGAGPAGSTTARLLAQRGASVLLLDRARFPRDKPCGGGVTVQAANELDIDLSPVVERTIDQAYICYNGDQPFLRTSPGALTYMTQRCRLDAYLVEQAVAAGVDFRDGVRVQQMQLEEDGVAVESDGETYRARTLVGADGVNGPVARSLGLAPTGEALVALEANAPTPDGHAVDWTRSIALDLGQPSGGYGWLFPKGDHVNVGVIGWHRTGPMLRASLTSLCQRLDIDVQELYGMRGYRLPMHTAGAPIVRGAALLVGDAAGLVDPLSGEGIYGAFLSGRLAAEQLALYLEGHASDLDGYDKAIDLEIMSGITFSRTLHTIFHMSPGPWVDLMRRSDWFWRNFCRLVRGETTYTEYRRNAGPLHLVMSGAAKLGRTRTS